LKPAVPSGRRFAFDPQRDTAARGDGPQHLEYRPALCRLIVGQDEFSREVGDVLQADLAAARRITTGGRNGSCTRIGTDDFAWFMPTRSTSRLFA